MGPSPKRLQTINRSTNITTKRPKIMGVGGVGFLKYPKRKNRLDDSQDGSHQERHDRFRYRDHRRVEASSPSQGCAGRYQENRTQEKQGHDSSRSACAGHSLWNVILVAGWASTETKDRSNDIVSSAVWRKSDRSLKNFRLNPV